MTARHTGFTLLELLLATVLTVVLMVGVMAAVSSLGTARGAIEGVPTGGLATEGEHDPAADPRRGASADPSDRAWTGEAVRQQTLDRVAGLLEHDLREARWVRVEGDGSLTLSGWLARNDDGRQRVHRPVEVRYRASQIDGRWWLVRRQTLLDVPGNERVQRDLVAGGVRAFDLSPADGRSLRGPEAIGGWLALHRAGPGWIAGWQNPGGGAASGDGQATAAEGLNVPVWRIRLSLVGDPRATRERLVHTP